MFTATMTTSEIRGLQFDAPAVLVATQTQPDYDGIRRGPEDVNTTPKGVVLGEGDVVLLPADECGVHVNTAPPITPRRRTFAMTMAIYEVDRLHGRR